jgi:predicted lipoprotein with Yx(FWY)xxD motif
MNKWFSLNFMLVGILAAVVAGCGSSNSSTSSNSSSAPAQKASGSVSVASSSSLGRILVDSSGRTLYLFGKDQGSKSSCSGACASNWPPATATGAPKAGTGLTAAKLETTTRSDGSKQLTYNGHPLYRYSGDQSPGDTNGQGQNAFGGVWYALTPAGDQTTQAAGSGGSGGSGSGY